MMKTVGVCIVTYKRPEYLARLLDALAGQRFDDLDQPAVRVYVVDNDAEATGRAVCDRVVPSFRWPLEYRVEPARGITYARNRALELSRECDLVAFIDDDEIPVERWLAELIVVQRDTGADVVAGPVMPRFVAEPEPWIMRGRFFDRPRYATGTELPYAGTGNVLMTRSMLDAQLEWFRHEFALTGGEDTEFFGRVKAAGARIVWADEALAYEWVPPSRMNARWLMQRAYRKGNTTARCEVGRGAGRMAMVIGGVARLLVAFALLPFAATRGRAGVVRMLQRLQRGAGMLAGSLGHVFAEYSVVHGE